MALPLRIQYSDLVGPMMVQWELTFACNNNCVFCHNPPRRVEWADELVAMNVLRQLTEHKVFRIVFTGGEPTLHPLLPDLISRVTEAGLEAGLITNGLEAAQALLPELKKRGLNSVQISIHSADPAIHDLISGNQGAHRQSVGTVQLAKSLGMGINVNATITSMNPGLVELCAMVRELGADSFTCTRYAQTRPGHDHLVAPFDRTREEILELIAYGKENSFRVKLISPFPLCAFSTEEEAQLVAQHMVRCDGGLGWVTITPDGRVKPCPPWNLDCGSLLETDLRTLWRTSCQLKDIRDRRYVPDECKECKNVAFCRAGCRACAIAGSYSADVLDPLAVDAPLKALWRSPKLAGGSSAQEV